MISLAYGARSAVPDDAHTAWGARLVWPNDLVWDRQDIQGPDAKDLMDWLNAGRLKEALRVLGELADAWELRPTDDKIVELWDTDDGRIVANPQASHGYVYVAAWLKR